MTDPTTKKSSSRLWIIVLVIAILALFWFWKQGGMSSIGGANGTGDSVGEIVSPTSGGPRALICTRNGGTWNPATNNCDMPPPLADTGEVEPLIETGSDVDDGDITVSGEAEVEVQ